MTITQLRAAPSLECFCFSVYPTATSIYQGTFLLFLSQSHYGAGNNLSIVVQKVADMKSVDGPGGGRTRQSAPVPIWIPIPNFGSR